MLHVYGFHIFHTSNERVWDYVRRFDRFVPFINQLFRTQFSATEALVIISTQDDKSITDLRTFEDQSVCFIGQKSYDTFFRGYTRKQRELELSELQSSILKCLCVRFNYYRNRFQGIPDYGYTCIVDDKILNHAEIHLHLSADFFRAQLPVRKAGHIVYSSRLVHDKSPSATLHRAGKVRAGCDVRWLSGDLSLPRHRHDHCRGTDCGGAFPRGAGCKHTCLFRSNALEHI